MALPITIGGDGSLFLGEDKTLHLEVLDATSTPIDISGWNILFDVRLKDNSDAPAIFSKTASIVGTYNVDRTANSQRAEVMFTDDELSVGVVKAKTYRCSWKRTDEGVETILAWGDFIIEEATAHE